MTDLKEDYESWLNTYQGNLLVFNVDATGVEYSVDINALKTNIEDGMYGVELWLGKQPYMAVNKICIVDGMVALQTLKPVIEEHLRSNNDHPYFEGVQLLNGNMKLLMGS